MKRIRFVRTAVQIMAAVIAATVLAGTPEPIKLALLAITLLGGAFYCGWLCPLGLVQDLASGVGRRLGIRKRKVTPALHNTMLYGRYILAVAAALWTADIVFNVLAVEPYGSMQGILAGNIPSMVALAVLAFFTIVSVFYDRAFCRYLCPEGAKFGVISLARMVTVRRNPHTCVKCGKCDRVCPMQINVSRVENLRSPQCINCMECVAACPVKGALSYGIVKKTQP